ncbi:MAG: hypothetical protein V4613_08710 [Bacteroidota bacterium]
MENTKDYLLNKKSLHLYPNITDDNIEWLCQNTELEDIQFEKQPHDSAFKKLNEKLFKLKPNIKLRLFTFFNDGSWSDLSFLKYLDNLEHLTLDFNIAENLNNIRYLNNLKSLSFSSNNPKLSLTPLLELNHLVSLYTSAKFNDFEKIAKISTVENLYVSSIKENQLDVLIQLPNLKDLSLGYGGIKDLSKLTKLNKLKRLELSALRSIENIHFVSDLTSIEHLSIIMLSKLKCLPNFSKCLSLKSIFIDVLNKLENIENLKTAKNLSSFIAYQIKKLEPEKFEIFEEMKNLKKARIVYDYSDRKNDIINEILSKNGISKIGSK